MDRSHADLVITAALAVLAGAAASAGAPTAVMVVLGIGLLAAPGYVWGKVLLGPVVTGLERVAVVAGLSLAGPVLGGLVLQSGGFSLHRATWVSLLVMLTLVGDAVLLRRRADQSNRADQHDRDDRPDRAVWTGGSATARRRRLPIWPVAAFAAAALIAAGGVVLARYGATLQRYPGFTQLWLTPPRGHASAEEVGVSNHQGTVMRYRLVLDRNGHTTATLDLTLADGQTWLGQMPFTGRSAISARLYRLPDLVHPYRHVFATVSTGPGP